MKRKSGMASLLCGRIGGNGDEPMYAMSSRAEVQEKYRESCRLLIAQRQRLAVERVSRGKMTTDADGLPTLNVARSHRKV